MQPKSRQLALLREATRYFASFRFLSGVVLEKLMGYYSWFFSLERLLFSLTGATYLFIETAGESWIPLWISVKHELLQLCDILPIARGLGMEPVNFCGRTRCRGSERLGPRGLWCSSGAAHCGRLAVGNGKPTESSSFAQRAGGAIHTRTILDRSLRGALAFS